jgi:hypothetical protein
MVVGEEAAHTRRAHRQAAVLAALFFTLGSGAALLQGGA